jgi:beta-phosphoglucomutase-like phosphatase (HAD superfamily)
MSLPYLILNTDELLFDFYLKKQQLWKTLAKRENLDINDKFIMGLYDAHLEKQEKIAREYRSLAPFVHQVQTDFKTWLLSFNPSVEASRIAFIHTLEPVFTIIYVTNQSTELIQPCLQELGLKYENLYSTKHVLNAKPEPDIYLKIARSLKIKANELVIVDSTLNGVQASYLAHAKGIFLEQYGPATQIIRKFSTTVISDLDTLKSHLLTLNQNA